MPPCSTLAPAAGSWLITTPLSTCALKASATVASSPAAFRASVASFCVWPTTSGTVTVVAPLPSDTVMSTSVSGVTVVPADGSWAATVPLGAVSSYASTGTACRPASARAAVASCWLIPVTSGTSTRSGWPRETSRPTDDPV